MDPSVAEPSSGDPAAPTDPTDPTDPGPLLTAMPFAVAAGVDLLRAEATEVEATLAWSPERCTSGGVMHGAALVTLADTVGAVCAFLNLPPGAGTSTIESKTNFFRAVRHGSVRAVARPIHVGRSTIGVQTEVRDDDAKLVALTFQTQAVLRP
ncbi:MAG: PaaI family thioesterase [Acidimicrobiales bacterium]